MDHKILLTKLPSWLTSWIAQYLSGRKQRVKCNNKHSEWRDDIAGVTQGSVLGPPLYFSTVPQLSSVLTTAELIKYTDDLLTYCIFNKPWTAYKNGQNKIKCDLISTKLKI